MQYLVADVRWYYFSGNMRKLKEVRNFFKKNKEYSVYGSDENAVLSADVAESGSTLNVLIKELNEYTRKNHGTTDFSVIQNKTDRKINVMYENATSKLAFPTYIGLMGTFLGVFIGLCSFNYGLYTSTDGITDNAISNLIWGVLVSMGTSFIGLLLTTISNHNAAETQKIVGEDKNEFFEFIQNELMPILGVSMVAALNKLHQTINLFEPSFNRVIGRFQTTFDTCTQRFGDAFEQNVTVVSKAVRVMGTNMDKINQNVDLQAQLLRILRSRGVVESLDAFVKAAQNFDHVTNAIQRFEAIREEIAKATIDLVNTQRRYNESLETPLTVANKINQILSRVTTFEKSIEALGRNIQQTDLLGNTEVEALKDAIKAIKMKQKIAVEAMEMSDGHLENIFKMQSESIAKLGHVYETSLAEYAQNFENILEGLGIEMQERRREIVAAIEEKFSLEQIQQEFANLSQLTHLSKLESIEAMLSSINSNSSRKDVEKTLAATRSEVKSIRKTLNELMEEAKKKPKGEDTSKGGFLNGIFGYKK